MSGLPTARLDDMPPAQVETMIADVSFLYELGREKPKSDQEYQERIDKYFEYCRETGVRPGIEGLCLVLHCGRTSLYEWGKGINCSKEKHEIIARAKAFINTYLEMASISGRLNPATSIFLMKNWLGYKDTVSLENITEQGLKAETKSLEEIASQFQNAELPPPIDLD